MARVKDNDVNAQSGNQCSCWRRGCCWGRSSLCWWLLSAPTLRWEKAPSAPGFTKRDASSERAPAPANPRHVHIFPCPADTFLPSSLARTSLPSWTRLLQPQGLAWGAVAGTIFIPGGVRLSLLFGCALLCSAVCPFSSRSPAILRQPRGPLPSQPHAWCLQPLTTGQCHHHSPHLLLSVQGVFPGDFPPR